MYRTRTVYLSAGFSLVELMVVLAVMAAMALVAAPWFMKISQRNQLKSAANEIQTTLMAARMTAVRRNAPVSVTITIAGVADSAHFFDTIEPPPPPPTPPPAARRIQISTKTLVFPVAPASPITFGGDGRITAPPPPAVVQIQGPVRSDGTPIPNTIRIEVANSGRVKVITPVAWY